MELSLRVLTTDVKAWLKTTLNFSHFIFGFDFIFSLLNFQPFKVINYVDKIEDNMIEVLFCDYGNFEKVNTSQIRNLPTDMNRPKFAIKVSISPGDILDRNRDQLQSWENEEDPKIQLYEGSIKIKGETPEKYFDGNSFTSDYSGVLSDPESKPEPNKLKAEMPKVHNGYTQLGIELLK